MIRAILFDLGGTLDGDGLHWLERFLVLYRECGVDLPRATIRAAFDEAERRSLLDETIASSNFAEMTALHVSWQLTHLGLTNDKLAASLVDGFTIPVRAAVAENARLLQSLGARGYILGVVSNGCGNVEKLCADFGFAPFLSAIVDSRRVGLFKPDPAIFRYAAEKIGVNPEAILMVGDSFERDVRPAKTVSMRTAWLEGIDGRDCPDPSLVDLRLRRLADLPSALYSNFAMSASDKRPLRAGILAAGRGERLRTPSSPLKPLVKVRGQTLIEHVLTSMVIAEVSEVVVIINQDSLAVRDHVLASSWPFRLRWIVENPPTSMHSFLRLVETLAADGDDGPFLLSTVDTIASAQTFAHFMEQARRFETADVTLALTSPGDDTKPLFVKTAPDSARVVSLGEAAAPSEYVTAGIYAVRSSILREAESARRDGVDALRTFFGRLLEHGYKLAGISTGESIDVDRPADIETAETFLRRARI